MPVFSSSGSLCVCNSVKLNFGLEMHRLDESDGVNSPLNFHIRVVTLVPCSPALVL